MNGRPSLAPVRRCVEAGLALPLPNETQRDVLKNLARAYCHTDDAIEAMTDADLREVWREGFGEEPD